MNGINLLKTKNLKYIFYQTKNLEKCPTCKKDAKWEYTLVNNKNYSILLFRCENCKTIFPPFLYDKYAKI